MSEETSRQSSVLKIHKEDDEETYVKIRIIDKITFVDPADHNQESEYTFDNSQNSIRTVRVEDVKDLKVERIENFNMRDGPQEYLFTLLTDPKAHTKTHEVKIYRMENGERDESTWIKVERIDELSVTDPGENGQETTYALHWPDLEIEDWDANSEGGELCQSPIRLDPFQNITDAEFSGYAMFIEICNVNSVTDDNFNLSINGKNIMSLDFSPMDIPTSYVIRVGPSKTLDKYAKPDGVVSQTMGYESFKKSPFKFMPNTINFDNTASNGWGNYFTMRTLVYTPKGEEVFFDEQSISLDDGESTTLTLDLSSLSQKKS